MDFEKQEKESLLSKNLEERLTLAEGTSSLEIPEDFAIRSPATSPCTARGPVVGVTTHSLSSQREAHLATCLCNLAQLPVVQEVDGSKVSSGDSEAKPLIFSFVPTVRRLPTHIQLADTSKYLVKIPEEPGDKSPETINRSKSIDYVTFNLGSGQEGIQGSPLTCPSEDFETNSQGGGFKANDLQRMQQGDLFKAEYVFIVDSEGEDEVTSRKGEQGAPGSTSNTVARPTTLAISSSLVSDVVRPKVWGPEPKAVSQAGTPQEMASKQKQEQPARPGPADPEELRTPGPGSEGGSRPLGPHAARPASQAPKQTREGPRAPRSPAREARGRDAASYIPVRIVTHALSPSPQPLSAPFCGASPASSRRSSSGSLSRSGLKSPVPSRLSLLTAILKSDPSHRRPASPASCPAFAPHSLAASTSALDRRAEPASPAPRKALSSGSLGAGPPGQEGPQAGRPGLAPPAALTVETLPSPARSQPHTGASSAAALLPGPAGSGPPPASKGKQDADLGRGEEPGDIDMHPSPASAPWASPINQSATLSSPGRSYCPSPALSHLIERSRKAAPHFSGQRPSPPAAPPLPRPRSSGSAASLLRLEPPFLSPANPPIPTLPPSPAALRPRCARNTLPARMGTPESTRSSCKPPVSAPAPPISLTRTKDLVSPSALSVATGPESKPKQYKTKSSYKVFAAIPTNTLLLEQKALDEPAQAESVSRDSSVDLPLEFCFPAQLRQQTEELCAAIDKVLQESLSMHSSDSPSRSPQQTLLGSETIKTSTTLPRSAGRETKYANLSLPSSTASESQLTKPGVIRPVPIKSRILLKKEEEVYEPNPFSKYLDDNSGFFSEQDVTVPPKPVSLHPLYQTKLYPPAKSLLHPPTRSYADCLSPGPFSHLSSFSLHDEQNSHALLSHNTYNKLSHPMVAIPEHETLDSKEMGNRPRLSHSTECKLSGGTECSESALVLLCMIHTEGPGH